VSTVSGHIPIPDAGQPSWAWIESFEPALAAFYYSEHDEAEDDSFHRGYRSGCFAGLFELHRLLRENDRAESAEDIVEIYHREMQSLLAPRRNVILRRLVTGEETAGPDDCEE